MLPYHGYQSEKRSESRGSQGSLRDWPRGEGSYLASATVVIMLFVPAWECEEETHGYEGKRNRSDTESREVVSLLERWKHPFVEGRDMPSI